MGGSKGDIMTREKYRDFLGKCLKLLADHEWSVGFASPEMVKGMSDRIENGQADEGEWFAIEMQADPIVKSAEKLVNGLQGKQ